MMMEEEEEEDDDDDGVTLQTLNPPRHGSH